MKKSAKEIIQNIEKVQSQTESNGSSTEELAENLNWKPSRARLYKYKLSKLPSDELEKLENLNCEISEEVLGAICLAPSHTRLELISRICSIQEDSYPLDAIDKIISELEEKHPLENLSAKYWIKIGDYLKDRSISHFAFHKKSINFIKSIGYNGGFENLSDKQKEWLIDLMKYDKNDVVMTDIFANRELLRNDFEDDYKTIVDFFKCL